MTYENATCDLKVWTCIITPALFIMLQPNVHLIQDRSYNSKRKCIFLPVHCLLYLTYQTLTMVYDNKHTFCPCTFLNGKQQIIIVLKSVFYQISNELIYHITFMTILYFFQDSLMAIASELKCTENVIFNEISVKLVDCNDVQH